MNKIFFIVLFGACLAEPPVNRYLPGNKQISPYSQFNSNPYSRYYQGVGSGFSSGEYNSQPNFSSSQYRASTYPTDGYSGSSTKSSEAQRFGDIGSSYSQYSPQGGRLSPGSQYRPSSTYGSYSDSVEENTNSGRGGRVKGMFDDSYKARGYQSTSNGYQTDNQQMGYSQDGANRYSNRFTSQGSRGYDSGSYSAGSYQTDNQYGRQGSLEDDQSGPAKYSFKYDVADSDYGTKFGQEEQRDKDTTSGSYYVSLPDGTQQIVKYTADADGYHPKISYSDEYASTRAGSYNSEGLGQSNGYSSGRTGLGQSMGYSNRQTGISQSIGYSNGQTGISQSIGYSNGQTGIGQSIGYSNGQTGIGQSIGYSNDQGGLGQSNGYSNGASTGGGYSYQRPRYQSRRY